MQESNLILLMYRIDDSWLSEQSNHLKFKPVGSSVRWFPRQSTFFKFGQPLISKDTRLHFEQSTNFNSGQFLNTKRPSWLSEQRTIVKYSQFSKTSGPSSLQDLISKITA
jgi:hypothetical protein